MDGHQASLGIGSSSSSVAGAEASGRVDDILVAGSDRLIEEGGRAQQDDGPWRTIEGEGSAPIPAGLEAKEWTEVVAQHIPADDYTCAICMDDMQEAREQARAGGSGAEVQQQPFAQLGCWHTFCELCVREYVSVSTARCHDLTLRSPTCREPLRG